MDERPTRVVTGSGDAEIEIRGSRFRALAQPVATAQEAELAIEAFRRRERRATHVCYAFRTERGRVSRAHDAAEPSGTAGRPILSAIEAASATDVIVLVARVFGGVKLGTGGLKRAYFRVAREAMDAARLAPIPRPTLSRTLTVPYPQLSSLELAVSRLGGRLGAVRYGAEVEVEVVLDAERDAELDQELARLHLEGEGS